MNTDGAIRKFEAFVSYVLMIMMGIIILLTLLDVGWLIINDVITPPYFFLESSELLDLFGMLLLVLIGLELLETICSFHERRVIKAEIIIIVAIIAVARKIIILDHSKLSSLTYLDIGVLVLALAAAYFLLNLVKEKCPINNIVKQSLQNERDVK
jgi:uncharacterized membrane protein (DUF373 family)